MKLVHDEIGSSDYKYWESSLKEFSAEDLLRGLKAAEDWTGYLLIGNFREMCRKPKTAAYHKPFQALPNKLGNERFQELMKVTKAMEKEGPNGPITRATNAGKLNKNFVRGKSAQEIINWCTELYA